MQNILGWFLSRMAEPSSYAGLGTAVGTVTHMATTGDTSSALIGAALAGLAAFFVGEKGKR